MSFIVCLSKQFVDYVALQRNLQGEHMKTLPLSELLVVAGGEIIPGAPSAEMLALLAKLMVAAGRGESGFDVSLGAYMLEKFHTGEFSNHDVAMEYARNGDVIA